MIGTNFDKVLTEAGGFGVFQKRVLVVVFIVCLCVYLQNNSPVFTMKIPRHRCKIHGFENDTYEIQNSYHAFLVNRSIPRDDEGDYFKCVLYDIEDGFGVTLGNRTAMTCDEWVYDLSVFKATYVTELDLVCHRTAYRSHSTMLVFAGKILGAFINSAAGDYFGRRPVFAVMVVAMTGTGVGLMFVSSLPALMLLRFLAGATTTGSYLPPFVIAVELLGKDQRSLVSLTAKVGAIGAGLLAVLFSFLSRDWFFFQGGLVAPCLFALVGLFFLPESPRWLLSKGKRDEAQKWIDKMANTNGVSVPPKLSSEMFDKMCDSDKTNGVSDLPKLSSEMVDKLVNSDEDTPPGARVTPLALFRVPLLFVRYTLLYLSWILLIMNLYGLNLNVTNMKGDIFLNFTLMSLVEIGSIVLFAVLRERVGRRLFLLSVAGAGGVACLSTILPTLLGGDDWILRGLSFTGKMCVGTGLSVIYIMSPELFPTVLRSFGLGSCSMFSRLGGLASPYVADLNILVSGQWGPALPQVVFGVAGIANAIMVFFLPETRGRTLPETVHDAEIFGRSGLGDRKTDTEFVVLPVVKKKSLTTEDTDA